MPAAMISFNLFASSSSTAMYSPLAGPVYSALGMVFFGSAPRCGGGESSSSPSPSRALPSGATAPAMGRGYQRGWRAGSK